MFTIYILSHFFFIDCVGIAELSRKKPFSAFMGWWTMPTFFVKADNKRIDLVEPLHPEFLLCRR